MQVSSHLFSHVFQHLTNMNCASSVCWFALEAEGTVMNKTNSTFIESSRLEKGEWISKQLQTGRRNAEMEKVPDAFRNQKWWPLNWGLKL